MPFAGKIIENLSSLWKRDLKAPVLRCLQGMVKVCRVFYEFSMKIQALQTHTDHILDAVIHAINGGLTGPDVDLTAKDALILYNETNVWILEENSNKLSAVFPLILQYINRLS